MNRDDYIDTLHALRAEHAKQMQTMTPQDCLNEENAILDNFLQQHQLQDRVLQAQPMPKQVA